MNTYSVEEAQAKLSELLDKLSPGETVLLVRDSTPIAQIISLPRVKNAQPILGRGQGTLIILSEDDDHLKDFEDYM